MAEIMILLIFILLMALAAALFDRERKLNIVNAGVSSQLIEVLRNAYPDIKKPEDYYKELIRAINMRREVEQQGTEQTRKQLLADAKLGAELRGKAAKAGSNDPSGFFTKAITRSNALKKGEWPPFFSLSEAGGYYFESGKATLKPQFEQKLNKTIIPLLRKNIEDYGVDVVEVIGHTDEVPMAGTSNLDTTLIAVSASRLPVEAMQSTDNAGLAAARAVAVVRNLRADPRLRGVTILPLSGAQLIVPTDRVADGTSPGDDQRRRRIEIRLRRSTGQQIPAS